MSIIVMKFFNFDQSFVWLIRNYARTLLTISLVTHMRSFLSWVYNQASTSLYLRLPGESKTLTYEAVKVKIEPKFNEYLTNGGISVKLIVGILCVIQLSVFSKEAKWHNTLDCCLRILLGCCILNHKVRRRCHFSQNWLWNDLIIRESSVRRKKNFDKKLVFLDRQKYNCTNSPF